MASAQYVTLLIFFSVLIDASFLITLSINSYRWYLDSRGFVILDSPIPNKYAFPIMHNYINVIIVYIPYTVIDAYLITPLPQHRPFFEVEKRNLTK